MVPGRAACRRRRSSRSAPATPASRATTEPDDRPEVRTRGGHRPASTSPPRVGVRSAGIRRGPCVRRRSARPAGSFPRICRIASQACPPWLAWSRMLHRNVAGSDGDLVPELAEVGAGVEGAGLRVVGQRQVVQRERRVAAGSRRAPSRCLTRTLVTRLRPVMFLPRISRLSFTKPETWLHRDRRGCAARPRGRRARP